MAVSSPAPIAPCPDNCPLGWMSWDEDSEQFFYDDDEPWYWWWDGELWARGTVSPDCVSSPFILIA